MNYETEMASDGIRDCAEAEKERTVSLNPKKQQMGDFIKGLSSKQTQSTMKTFFGKKFF